MKKYFLLLVAAILSLCILTACDLGAKTKEDDTESSDAEVSIEQVIYKTAQDLGFEGTLEEFLALVKGADGVGISNIEYGRNNKLVVTLTNGKDFSFDLVAPQDGANGKDGSDGKDGADGVSIENVEISSGYLVVTMSNGRTINCGKVTEEGEAGKGIAALTIDANGNLVVSYTDETEQNLGKVVGEAGADGNTPSIIINDEGYWVINGNATEVKAQGEKGEKGDTGAKGDTGDTGAKGDKGDTGAKGDTGEKGEKGDKGDDGSNGSDGDTPTIVIDGDGYWTVNGVSTGVKAQGEKGDKGDTGATGEKGDKGEKGDTGEKGADGTNGTNGANGSDGTDGKSAFDIYCEYYDYTGTEEEWIEDLVAGNLLPTTYEVTIIVNGTEYHQNVVENGTIDFSEINTERAGYSFTGWTCDAEAFALDTPITAEITITAQYQEAEITVTRTIDGWDEDDIVINNMERVQIIVNNYNGAAAKTASWTTEQGTTKYTVTVESSLGSDSSELTTATYGSVNFTDFYDFNRIILDITYRCDDTSTLTIALS